MTKARSTIQINRAPVLTLWAAVVAERLGYRPDEALTLGKAVAGLNAYRKGRGLGIYEGSGRAPTRPAKKNKAEAAERDETVFIDLLDRAVPARRTADGLRAMNRDRVITSESVERYLAGKFGDGLDDARSAMRDLATSLPKDDLAGRAFELYEAFRPQIPRGKKGWGAAGTLDLDVIRSLGG